MFFMVFVLESAFTQKTIHATMLFGGQSRTFSYYVPACVVPSQTVPLVFNLHGYGSNGDQQEFYGDFRKIADTACFIVVHPTGTKHPITDQTFWNCGLVAGAGNVDDVGFIHALIDTLSTIYTIDPDRIYSTGMSNGGFMSYHLACTSDRFAAIASVAGSMTTFTRMACTNASATPIMEVHGTADSTIKYDGQLGMLSIPELLDFWITKNSLDGNALIKSDVANVNLSDGATAELYVYPGTHEVEHYKVIGGGHTWPGAVIAIGVTCQDFNASLEIWKFFSKHRRSVVRTQELPVSELGVQPNPAARTVQLHSKFTSAFNARLFIYDQYGKLVKEFENVVTGQELDVANLNPGMYFLRLISSEEQAKGILIKI